MTTTFQGEPFRFDNTYARELGGLFAPWKPARVSAPVLLRLNRALAGELGLDAEALTGDRGAAVFSGNTLPAGAEPLAQAYAGHQFGGFSPQLGDGRALLLGELIDQRGRRRDIAFKGSGATPFSRGGDGKAAVGPVLREFVIGEAMHALGIPTTRALAAVATGEPVYREQTLPGAVLTRVAASHLRVGTFEYFAARGDLTRLKQLADYAIRRHDPELAERPDPYLGLLRAVAERQAALVARWMHVGFIHGVMNTDNMTISGETIDYGPCAFLESYDPDTVFSSIDTHGRYAYGNQPLITRWNLARLAEALLPLIDPDDPARATPRVVEVIDDFPARYQAHWLAGARAKLGLADTDTDAHDLSLAHDWLALLGAQAVDFTLAWRLLADAALGDAAPKATPFGGTAPMAVPFDGSPPRAVPFDVPVPLRALFDDAAPLQSWLARWHARAQRDEVPAHGRSAAMRRVNPIYVPRNHLVEEALAAATDEADLAPFERLLDVLARPFDERPGLERFAAPAPAEVTACYRTFCGT